MTLTEWRTGKKLSMAELGDLVELSQSTISRIEAGKQWPDRATMQKIFDLSDGAVTPNDFVLPSNSTRPEQECSAQ